jgi:hypothetical protein
LACGDAAHSKLRKTNKAKTERATDDDLNQSDAD